MQTLRFALAPLSLVCVFPVPLLSQSQAPVKAAPQSVTVTTQAEPLPLADSGRSVRLLDLTPTEAAPLFNSPEDYLRLDPSLNLQERGPGGVQADLSIRGTTFEQTLVLVDGLRVNDAETGHLNLDLTLPLEAFRRIDVLHGSGSTFYGSDAIGGAVNFITAPATHSEIALKLGGGTYNATEQHLRADFASMKAGPFQSERLTASRDTSDGFYYQTPGGAFEDDRGFHNTAAGSDTFLKTAAGLTEVLLGISDRPYGANLFYGNYDSKERTKGWFGALRQEFGYQITADYGYRRHTDEFVLLASAPSVYENNHIDTDWQADVRQQRAIAKKIDLAYGVEADGQSIRSNSLGHHARNQGAGYGNLSLHRFRRLSLSVGTRTLVYAGPTAVFSPSAAASYALGAGFMVRAAYGQGFRLPTYVDLYYSDPGTLGNPALQPETSQSYEGGIDFARGPLQASATGFQLRQSNAIDYVKANPADKWQALNVGQVNYSGLEATTAYTLSTTQRIDVGYTWIHASPAPAGLLSEYAYNFAAQNATLSYSALLAKQVSVRAQLGVVQKTGDDAYPLLSLALARSHGLVRPYVRLENLSNTLYFEVPGPPAVPMPGRTVIGGILLNWPTQKNSRVQQ